MKKKYEQLLEAIKSAPTHQDKALLAKAFADAHDLHFLGFEYSGAPHFYEPTPDTLDTYDTAISELTNTEIKELLDANGIEYPARANKKTLLDLLDA